MSLLVKRTNWMAISGHIYRYFTRFSRFYRNHAHHRNNTPPALQDAVEGKARARQSAQNESIPGTSGRKSDQKDKNMSYAPTESTINQCLTLLRGPKDEQRMAGLLLAAKVIPR